MKGIVFTEFIEMVEANFGPEIVDDVLDSSGLPNGGSYTAVGTYDHQEIVRMVVSLSRITGRDAHALIKAFGEHLAGRFAELFPQFFANTTSTFDFLPQVETYIHVEVRKLYPDAELPSFTCERVSPDKLTMIYKSGRPFADLAEGLIRGSAKHFNETISIERHDLSPESGYSSRFDLSLGQKSDD